MEKTIATLKAALKDCAEEKNRTSELSVVEAQLRSAIEHLGRHGELTKAAPAPEAPAAAAPSKAKPSAAA